MKVAEAGRYARAVIGVAASRGRAAETADVLSRAAAFFGSADGRAAAALLQSSRVPRGERSGLLDEIAQALSLNDETRALVESFADLRALRSLPAVAARARELAAEAAPVARAELRTAFPLPEAMLGRVRDAAARTLGRPVEIDVVEDGGLLGGVVLRSGNRIWDGSLAGALDRARRELGGA